MIDTKESPCFISSTTRHNASDNAYYTVLNFLEGKRIGDEYWCPKNITDTLNKNGHKIAEATVRGVLKELRAQGKVFYVPKGKIHLYASSRRFANDFNYMFKTFGVRNPKKERYEIHGLTLNLKAESLGQANFNNAIPLGGVVRDGWGVRGAGLGETSFQLCRDCLTVYVSCSNAPFDFDRFVAWLAQVDGFLVAKRWVRVEGNLGCWSVVQCGLNKDYLKINLDSLPVAVSLQGFRHWFARVYDKVLADGSHVIRSEVHNNDEVSFESFLSLASGSMGYAQVMNLVQGVAISMDNSVARLTDLERAMVKMARTFESISKRMDKHGL